MKIESLNHYGYNKDTYKKCMDSIRETDINHVKILNTWFTVLTLFTYIVSNGKSRTLIAGKSGAYLAFFLIALAFEVFVILGTKKVSALKMRLAVFFNIVLMFCFAYYSSTSQPYMPAAMFPVLLVVVAIAYIDNFLNMTLISVAGAVAFGFISRKFKPLSIANIDIYNVVIFGILALILHYTFQHVRISGFVTFYENREFQRNLEVKSSFDALTSLLNRGRFFTMAGEILRSTHDDNMAVCLFDLDGFKQINDKLGHQMGDKAIQITGENLMKGFQIDFGEKWDFERRAVDEKLSFAGRLGGDEFIVFLRGRKGREDIKAEAEKVLENLANVKAGELNGIRSSVGIVLLGPDDRDIDIAYSRADEALYKSKEAGKHMITFSETEA